MGQRNIIIYADVNGSVYAFAVGVYCCKLIEAYGGILCFPPKLYAVNPTFNNFLDLWDIFANMRVPLSRYIYNTLFASITGTVLAVVFGIMGAYVLSKHDFPGKAALNRIIVVALLYTGNILAVPRYLIISRLNWLDTSMAVLAPTLASTMCIFLLRQFITTVPNAMLESARIDGAGEFRICFQMVAPNVTE